MATNAGMAHVGHDKVTPRKAREFYHYMQELYIQAREFQQWEGELMDQGLINREETLDDVFKTIRERVGRTLLGRGFDLTDL